MIKEIALKRRLLVLEINEISWRIIDKFKNLADFPNINRFFSSARTYTTTVEFSQGKPDDFKLVHGFARGGNPVVIDSGELSPWVTWPTFHRGIKSSEHGIKFLGQDIRTFKGKPIWQEFVDRGYSIGICGSLQSWPPANPGENGFYIPDTFAHDESCIPKYIEPFQKFNLEQVQKNGLVIRQSKLISRNLLALIMSLPRLGISLNTILKIANQLLLELFDKSLVAKRPTFQCILLWDIFKSLYKPANPPAFSTFFTNHFANLMHRYWHDIFPEDFGDDYRDYKRPYLKSVFHGLKVVDEIIGNALEFCEANRDITLVFATSMGQDAIKYASFEGYSAELENVVKLFDVFGFSSSEYNPLLAMVPQFAVEVKNTQLRSNMINYLENCFSKSGSRLFSVDEAGDTISITIHTPPLSDIKEGGFTYKRIADGKNLTIKWHEAGIVMHKLEAATGYHIPEGILAIMGKDIKPNDVREQIKLSEVKNLLMDLAFKENASLVRG